MRLDIPNYYYYARYLVPFLPIAFVLGAIAIEKIRVRIIIILATISIMASLLFSYVLVFQNDDSRVEFATLENLIDDINKFDDDSIVIIHSAMLQTIYFPLEISVNKTILPGAFDFIKGKNNVYSISNVQDNGTLYSYNSTYSNDEGTNREYSLPLPTSFRKYDYKIFLLKKEINYDLGYKVEFNEASGRRALDYLISGLNIYPDEKFIWSSGYKSEFQFKLKEYTKQNDLKMDINFFWVFATPTHFQTIKAYVGENLIAEKVFYYDEEKNWSFTIPKDIVKDTILSMKFEYPDAATPIELNITTDPRVLAFAWQDFTITEIIE
jgi:hypothetical protein